MTLSSPVILALECSAGQATAALSHNGEVIVQTSHIAAHGHAAWMIPLAQDAVKQSGFSFDQLSHIVAGRGPGSFTGIRVALAAAKGLALSLRIGATGLSSLAGMAAQMKKDKMAKDRHLITSIDSRRGSMFVQSFLPGGTPLTDIRDGDINLVKALIAEYDVPWAVSGIAAKDVGDLNGDVISVDCEGPEATGLLGHFEQMMTENIQGEAQFIDLDPLYLSAPLLGPRS